MLSSWTPTSIASPRVANRPRTRVDTSSQRRLTRVAVRDVESKRGASRDDSQVPDPPDRASSHWPALCEIGVVVVQALLQR